MSSIADYGYNILNLIISDANNNEFTITEIKKLIGEKPDLLELTNNKGETIEVNYNEIVGWRVI